MEQAWTSATKRDRAAFLLAHLGDALTAARDDDRLRIALRNAGEKLLTEDRSWSDEEQPQAAIEPEWVDLPRPSTARHA